MHNELKASWVLEFSRSSIFDYMANAMQDAQIVLAKMAYAQWLKVHGKLKRPEMSKKQELELKECFELMDAGGSGVIALDDVPLAFTVLGMDMKRPEIDVVLAGVKDCVSPILADHDGETGQAAPRLVCSKRRWKGSQYSVFASLQPLSSSLQKEEDILEYVTNYDVRSVRQLIEAVMGGDRPLQDRMNFRSGQVAIDRQELRDAAAGKPKKREKRGARPAKSKKSENNDRTAGLMYIPHYLLDTMSADVKEVLLRNNSTSLKTNGTEPGTKIMPSRDNISDEIGPWTVGGGTRIQGCRF